MDKMKPEIRHHHFVKCKVQHCFVILVVDPLCNFTSFLSSNSQTIITFVTAPSRKMVPWKKSNMNWFFSLWIMTEQSFCYCKFLLLYKNRQDDGLVDGWGFPSFVTPNIWRSIPRSSLDLHCHSQRQPSCSNILRTSIQRLGCSDEWIWK